MVRKLSFLLLFSTLFLGTTFAQDDPPSRVLRLNYMDGNVSMEPSGIDDWAPAVINRPFTIGDYLYTDQGSRAELHTDVAAIRMGEYTNFGILNLTDTTVQLKMTQGDMYFTVHDLDPSQVFEVDTPNAAINILRSGIYRLHVDSNANTTLAIVREGQLEVTGGGQAFTLDPGNSATLAGTDQLSYDVEPNPDPDAFGMWCAGRDAHWAHVQSARYLPPTVIGYEDLDDNGSWAPSPQYGNVWYPRSVPGGWAPYHNGHWAWVEPWGWTWVDDMSWGFAPFHYGRWVFAGDRWGWAPGPMMVPGGGPMIHPPYAPAMVAWFGGAHFGVSISFGGGAPSVGWVPLGWGEVYTPTYQVSANYFRNVNIYNTRVVNTVNITNVYNTVYVNKTVYNQTFVNVHAPNAVVAMPQASFASGRTVSQGGAVFLKQDQVAHIQTAQMAVIAPSVAPTRQAVVPTMGRTAPHPPAQLMTRQVVARTAPPPPKPSFAAQQTYLQQHAGQPLNAVAMRRDVAPAARPAQPAVIVRQAPAARPAPVKLGAHVGNVQPSVVNGHIVTPGKAPNQGAPAMAQHATPPPAPAPNRPAAQPAAAAHGAAPTPANRGAQPVPNNQPRAERPATPAAPATRPGEPAARPAAPAARPEARPAAPAARPGEPAARPEARPAAPAAKPAEPAARPTPHPAEPARPAARPAEPAERPKAAAPAAHGAPPAGHTATHPPTNTKRPETAKEKAEREKAEKDTKK